MVYFTIEEGFLFSCIVYHGENKAEIPDRVPYCFLNDVRDLFVQLFTDRVDIVLHTAVSAEMQCELIAQMSAYSDTDDQCDAIITAHLCDSFRDELHGIRDAIRGIRDELTARTRAGQLQDAQTRIVGLTEAVAVAQHRVPVVTDGMTRRLVEVQEAVLDQKRAILTALCNAVSTVGELRVPVGFASHVQATMQTSVATAYERLACTMLIANGFTDEPHKPATDEEAAERARVLDVITSSVERCRTLDDRGLGAMTDGLGGYRAPDAGRHIKRAQGLVRTAERGLKHLADMATPHALGTNVHGQLTAGLGLDGLAGMAANVLTGPEVAFSEQLSRHRLHLDGISGMVRAIGVTGDPGPDRCPRSPFTELIDVLAEDLGEVGTCVDSLTASWAADLKILMHRHKTMGHLARARRGVVRLGAATAEWAGRAADMAPVDAVLAGLDDLDADMVDVQVKLARTAPRRTFMGGVTRLLSVGSSGALSDGEWGEKRAKQIVALRIATEDAVVKADRVMFAIAAYDAALPELDATVRAEAQAVLDSVECVAAPLRHVTIDAGLEESTIRDQVDGLGMMVDAVRDRVARGGLGVSAMFDAIDRLLRDVKTVYGDLKALGGEQSKGPRWAGIDGRGRDSLDYTRSTTSGKDTRSR